MPAPRVFNLELDRAEILSHAPSESLFLIDLDTYVPYVSRKADHLDIMVHLDRQINALTALSWNAPAKTLRMRFLVTASQSVLEQIAKSHRPGSAFGTLRTHGRVVFTTYEHLSACARDPKVSVFEGRLPKTARPQLLHLPPGLLYPYLYHPAPHAETDADRTLVLHHYPHPAPRIAPTRLPGLDFSASA